LENVLDQAMYSLERCIRELEQGNERLAPRDEAAVTPGGPEVKKSIFF